MMNIYKFFLGVLFLFPTLASCQQKVEPFPDDDDDDKVIEYLADWQEGYLDIHQISTGRGNAAYLIFPDGTTMLIDAGDLGIHTGSQEIMKPMPNSSKTPAEWIAHYIKHFSAPLDKGTALDYALITHFDRDHVGSADDSAIMDAKYGYKLSGITHLGNLLDIGTLVDRDYPNYNYPSASRFTAAHIVNYKLYVADRDNLGKKNEGFVVGSNSQFKLLKKPSAYPTFEVRNVVGNGKIWTGSGTGAEEMVPSTASSDQQFNENRTSCGIRITYGNFDYFSAGDILGVQKSPEWFDIETPVGRLIEETDVVVANHHAYSDAMTDTFISLVKAQAYIIPVWDYYHPQPKPLADMLSTNLYPGERMVFAAGLVASNRSRLGENGTRIKPDGHVVTRVYQGGDKFQVFVLNDTNDNYEIIYKTTELKSNN